MEKDTSTDAAAVEAIKGTNGRYQWTKHLNINVIEDTTNGFINASKMCSMYGKTKTGQPKKFTDWKYTNKAFMAHFACTIGTSELMYAIVNGIDTIKGTYIHSELFPHIAEWCGIDIHNYDVVHKCQSLKNRIKRQKVSKTGFIYVLSAPMFSYYGANVYKVGYTENLKQRMKGYIGIPERKYVYTKEVDSINDEQKTHALLRPFRLFDNHELFDAPLEVIIESINTCLQLQISSIRDNIVLPKDTVK